MGSKIAPAGEDKTTKHVNDFAPWPPVRGRGFKPGDNETMMSVVIVATTDHFKGYGETLETLRDRHRVIATLSPHVEVMRSAIMVCAEIMEILDTLERGGLIRSAFTSWPATKQKIAFRAACRTLRIDTVTSTEIESRSRP